MRYRACIFDLDGTLADTLASIAGFGNTALGEFGLPPLPVEAYRLLVGNGADVLLRRMVEAVGGSLSQEEMGALRKTYDRLYERDPLGGVTPYPGLPQALAALRARGVRLGVLSNKPDNMTKAIGEALYPGLLDEIQGQLPQVPKKPDPQGLLDLARRLGATPSQVLYVGDSGVDMETGKNGGMDPCGVLWGFRDKEELLSHGAKFLVSTAEELLAVAEIP